MASAPRRGPEAEESEGLRAHESERDAPSGLRRGGIAPTSSMILYDRMTRPADPVASVGPRGPGRTHPGGTTYAAGKPRLAPEEEGMSAEMPDPAAFKEVLEAAGVTADSRIVVYSATTPSALTARLYLTLEDSGLGGNTSLLDGGLSTWKKGGRSTPQNSTEVVRCSRSPTFASRLGCSLTIRS